jgi:hypothetical protein
MDNPFAAVVAELDFLGQDNALLNSALYKNPDFVAWCERIADRQHKVRASVVTPLPALETILALEATVFDNGPEPKFRHKISLQTYMGDHPNWKRPNWKGTATLWPHDVAVKTAKKSKAKFSEATLAVVEALAGQGSGFVGVFMHTGAGMGSTYNDQHVVWIDIEANTAMVYSPNAHFWLAPFDKLDAKGKPLKSNGILHSRSSSADTLDHWSTGEPVSL